MPGSNLVKQGHPKMPRVERVGEPTVHGGWSDIALFAISKTYILLQSSKTYKLLQSGYIFYKFNSEKVLIFKK